MVSDFMLSEGGRNWAEYDAEVSTSTYESLLDLASETMKGIAPLGARDMIDVQSFIWVVGAYREEDRPD